MSGQTIVLTGATSFLGRNVLRCLLDAGYTLYAFARDENALSSFCGERFHVIKGTLDEVEIISDHVPSAYCFIHFAWDGSGNQGRANREIQQKNIEYSMRALKTAQRLGCEKFIFSGSQAEYGIVNGLISENTDCRPISEYGKAKSEFSEVAERFCEKIKLDFIHLRIFSVYGADDRPGTLVDLCVRGFNSGKAVRLGPCSQMWNYLYINDFAEIIKRIVEIGSEGTYNVAGDDSRILRDYVKEIYELSNKSGSVSFEMEASNPEGSPSLAPDIGRLKGLIGPMEYTSFKNGIKEIMSILNIEV